MHPLIWSSFRLYYGDLSGFSGQVDSLKNTPPPPSILHPLQIGVRTRDGRRLEDFFDGMIDEVRVYRIPLDQAEIEELRRELSEFRLSPALLVALLLSILYATSLYLLARSASLLISATLKLISLLDIRRIN